MNRAPIQPVSLIGVPTDVGAGSIGARMGPSALRVAGLAQAIAAFGIDVKDCGDLQQMPPDFAVTELWQVLLGQAPGRTTDAEMTIFDSVGFALEDFSALRYMRDSALALGMRRTLALIPELDDPKNLFALVRPAAPAAAAAPTSVGTPMRLTG